MTVVTSARVLVSRVLDVVLRRRRDDRLSEEVHTHIELLTADYLARGLTPADARTAARRAFGGADQIKSLYRDQRGLPLLDALTQDLRFAMRLLQRDRGFASTAVFVLGIGIGVNNMLFTILNAHTIRGLPIARAERIVHLSTLDNRNQARGVSYPDYVDLRDSARGFAEFAAFTSAPVTVAGDGRAADRFDATFVTASAFGLIGVQPVLGRGFAADDDRPDSAPVAMLGSSAWQSRYGSDPAIVGRTIVVNGTPVTTIGIVPDRSGFPTTAEVWLLLRSAPGLAEQKRDVRNLRVLGRVRDDVTVAEARAEVDTITERLAADHPDTNKNVRARVVPINEQFFGSVTDPAWLAFISVGFLVVLISCANVANLMLAHSLGRAREFAIRTSLGASRRRILRQLLIEGLVLAGAGAVVGFGVSVAGVRLFRSAIPDNALPYWMDYSVDARVLAALALVSMATVFVFALLPALHASKSDVNRVLKDGGRAATAGRGARRWTTAFLAAEFALAVVLLSQVVISIRAAGPPVPSDRIINTREVVTAVVTLAAATYATPQQRNDVYRHLEERVAAIPGVTSVSMASVLPLTGGAEGALRIASGPRAARDAQGTVRTVVIGPRYFQTLGVRVTRGRELDENDGAPGDPHVIVNERLAEKFFAGDDPIGRQITLTMGDGSSAGALTIVGVAQDVRQRSVPDADPLVYLPYRAAPPPGLTLLARTSLGPAALVPLIRREVLAIDPSLPMYRFQTMAEVAHNADWNRRLSHMLVMFLTLVAAGLSTVGLYAVTAHGVSQRTQEIGVRMALGAQPRALVFIIVRRVLVQLTFGFVAGIICAVAWERTFGSADSQMRATDPQSLAAIAAILALAAVLACFAPARRATRLDPVDAIRAQ